MIFWNISFYITAILAVLLAIFLVFRGYGKNRYYHSKADDSLIHTKNEGGAKNYVYAIRNDTKTYIEKYIIRKSVYEKSLIVNYNKAYNSISYYVKVYNRKKVIQLIEVNDYDTSLISKIIMLSKDAKTVNIIIKEVNDTVINKNELMPMSRKNILLGSLFKTTLLFSSTYALRHLVATMFLTDKLRPFFYSSFNYILIAILFVLSLIFFSISYTSLKKKNKQNRNGGVVKYDFL